MVFNILVEVQRDGNIREFDLEVFHIHSLHLGNADTITEVRHRFGLEQPIEPVYERPSSCYQAHKVFTMQSESARPCLVIGIRGVIRIEDAIQANVDGTVLVECGRAIYVDSSVAVHDDAATLTTIA